MGRSVSSFDIAELVEPIRRERDQKRRAAKRQSIIGTLIDEAMLEFTSIDTAGERKSTAGSVVGSLPLEIGGFSAPNDWGEDLRNLGLSAPRSHDPTSEKFEIGNLAALEDDPLSARVRPLSSSPPDADSEPPPRVVPPPPSAQPLAAAPYARRAVPDLRAARVRPCPSPVVGATGFLPIASPALVSAAKAARRDSP